MGRIRRVGRVLDSFLRHRSGSSSKRRSTAPSWPTGVDGVLHVVSGDTYTFIPGFNYDFSSVTVDAGATLNTEVGTSPICIGCLGNFSVDSTVVWTGFLNDGNSGTYSRTAPDGTNISYSIAQSAGGNGGNTSSGNGGGISSYGSGGGGAGGHVSGEGFDDTSIAGGAGGVGGSGGLLPGGDGGSLGDPGNDGTTGSDDVGGSVALASGGGGGGRGYHGQGFYIKIGGQANCFGASMDLSGRNGGNGGGGGSADAPIVAQAGAGGGAASGGSGGFVKWRDKGTGTGRPSFVVDGGAAGSPGPAGSSTTGESATDGAPAFNGNSGSTNVGTW